LLTAVEAGAGSSVVGSRGGGVRGHQ